MEHLAVTLLHKTGTRMHTVIVGCGYVGMALAHFWQGYDLTLTTTTASREGELSFLGRVAVVKSAEKKKLKEVLEDADRIVVCVAPKNRDYSLYIETAEAISKCMPKTAHLVYTSSSSVYGEHEGAWVDEQSTLKGNPELIAAEQLYLQLPHVTVLRLSGIYGPNRGLEEIVPYFAGKESVDGYCNWVHIDDIVRAIDFVFDQELEGIFNICSDEHPKKSALYDPIIKRLGLEPAQWKEEGSSYFGNKRVSNQKIKQAGFHFSQALV